MAMETARLSRLMSQLKSFVSTGVLKPHEARAAMQAAIELNAPRAARPRNGATLRATR